MIEFWLNSIPLLWRQNFFFFWNKITKFRRTLVRATFYSEWSRRGLVQSSLHFPRCSAANSSQELVRLGQLKKKKAKKQMSSSETAARRLPVMKRLRSDERAESHTHTRTHRHRPQRERVWNCRLSEWKFTNRVVATLDTTTNRHSATTDGDWSPPPPPPPLTSTTSSGRRCRGFSYRSVVL